MKIFYTLLLGISLSASATAQTFFDHKTTAINGKSLDLSEFKGKTTLVVNTASRCGYTGQYEGLETLYQKYKDQGFVVVGMPSGSFNQELKADEEIAKFCKFKYGVKFPLTKKLDVTGKTKPDFVNYLVENSPPPYKGEEISWNFEKFLVDKSGSVVARFKSQVAPDDEKLIAAVEKSLKKNRGR